MVGKSKLYDSQSIIMNELLYYYINKELSSL